MKSWSKLAMTAGAIGAIGVAGSFGTFAAFTASDTHNDSITSGTIKVQNDFALPDWHNLGTAETDFSASQAGTTTPDYKKAGHITVKNTGSLPQDVYLDFDGPGVEDMTSPYIGSTNVLAENVIVDSSFDPSFGSLLDDGTRLYKVNRRGPTKVWTLAPGEQQTIYYRAYLRERYPGIFAGGDNEMQGQSIDEKVTVAAVEAGRDDLKITPPTSGADTGKNYDYGA